MASLKIAHASSSLTMTLASLASSGTLVAGRESTAIDNATNLYLDYAIMLLVKAGTSPTAGSMELWVVPSFDGTTWPDVFDGTDSAETATSRDVLFASARVGASVTTGTTTGAVYPLMIPSVARLFGEVPKKFALFLTHSMVAALDATEGSHSKIVEASYKTVA